MPWPTLSGLLVVELPSANFCSQTVCSTESSESLLRGLSRRSASNPMRCEDPGMEILQHGEDRLRNESVPGRLRRPRGIAPGPALFVTGSSTCAAWPAVCTRRRIYELMRYWDEDHPEWDAERREFAAAWRRQPKWVVSRSLKSVGPNATLVEDDIETVIRGLETQLVGEIAVSGPDLARSLTDLGLIDEYRLYFHPVVLGHGKPFFAGPRPPLRLVSTDRLGEDVIRLTYVPA